MLRKDRASLPPGDVPQVDGSNGIWGHRRITQLPAPGLFCACCQGSSVDCDCEVPSSVSVACGSDRAHKQLSFALETGVPEAVSAVSRCMRPKLCDKIDFLRFRRTGAMPPPQPKWHE